MTAMRAIEVDEETAAALEQSAAELGVSVAELLADFADMLTPAAGDRLEDPDPSIDERIYRHAVETDETMAFDELKPWIESWGRPDKLPPPKWRKSD